MDVEINRGSIASEVIPVFPLPCPYCHQPVVIARFPGGTRAIACNTCEFLFCAEDVVVSWNIAVEAGKVPCPTERHSNRSMPVF